MGRIDGVRTIREIAGQEPTADDEDTALRLCEALWKLDVLAMTFGQSARG